MTEDIKTPENREEETAEVREGGAAPAKTRRRKSTTRKTKKKEPEGQPVPEPSAEVKIEPEGMPPVSAAEEIRPKSEDEPAAGAAEGKPKPRRRSRAKKVIKEQPETQPAETPETATVEAAKPVPVLPEPAAEEEPVAIEEEASAEVAAEGEEAGQQPPKAKRRRRRRRSKKGKGEQAVAQEQPAAAEDDVVAEPEPLPEVVTEAAVQEEPIEAVAEGEQQKSKRRRRRRRKGKKQEGAEPPQPQERQEKKTEKPPKDRTKRILINAKYQEEKRVAIVEGDSLMDFYVELAAKEHLKGNIYKGVVVSIMPSLQAAFVDFGQKKHGFLQLREVMPELLKNNNDGKGGGLVKGQEVLVQVEKDERDTKGASLTTYISIPGRYIVMMPGQKRVGISRKIENREDRDRLKEIFNSLKLPPDMGFILRTACGDSLEKELGQDLKYLTKLWDQITADAEKSPAPSLIYKEHDISMRTIRDYLTTDVAEILIDDKDTYTATKAFLRKIMPSRKINVIHYKEKKPLFSLYNVEAQIARLSESHVRLPSHGYLVFDKAEALTAIDVNSGRSRKEDNVESMALATNLEAADEVARQLRLRDIGGLIVIDFIDMESSKNRRLVERRIEDAMSTDKANTEFTGLSKFCILEMTRERLRPAYAEAISRKCPLCSGRGAVNSDEFVALGAVRELHARAEEGDCTAITCRLSVESANRLVNSRKAELVALEKEFGVTISIAADPSVPAGQYVMEVQKQK
ncbi:MAG: Rne/Rng family ribonuclease [Nitrospirales bacterium]|nr:Rne/Rng family ribonuclease [Nitrospirales bacterium]